MKKSGCVIVILFVAVCTSMFGNLVLLALLGVKGAPAMAAARLIRERKFEEIVVQEGGTHASRVAVIPLEGIIAVGQAGALGTDMVNDFKLALDQARHDATVKAVVVAVDSPGGEITASDVLYNALRQFVKEKPAVVYFNAIGTSGAYYAACGGSYIMCNQTTFTGSIGVIISTLNYRDLLGKVGLEAVVFRSGKFKDMLSGSREMTPEERAYVQGLVMQSYGRFLGIVAGARDLDEGALSEGPADGRVMSGTDALEAGLVDQLGYIEDAFNKARELGKAPGAQVIRYRRTATFSDLFTVFGEALSPRLAIDLMPGRVVLEPGRVYLLPPVFAP
jgi:protease IV